MYMNVLYLVGTQSCIFRRPKAPQAVLFENIIYNNKKCSMGIWWGKLLLCFVHEQAILLSTPLIDP